MPLLTKKQFKSSF